MRKNINSRQSNRKQTRKGENSQRRNRGVFYVKITFKK